TTRRSSDLLHVEVQVLAGHRVVEVHVDHAHADLLHGHRARAEVGLQHDLHARGQLRIAEVLLRDALGQAVATLAIGLGGRDVDAEALAGLLVHHRLLQAGDDVAVADQDRDRLTLLRALQRLLADFGDGVVETDDAVFFDLHAELGVAAGGSGGWAACRPRAPRPSWPP